MSTLALPFLAACQTLPSADEILNSDQLYVARGNEPGWILKMDGQTIDYLGNYGETKIKVPAPQGHPSFNGMRYVTDRLTVDVTYASCADGMSGKRFADTVTVLAYGMEYKGCGGRTLPPESLNDTSWTILLMDQLPVIGGVNNEVRFADGKVSGTAGCNRFNGSYSVAGNVLTFGAVASTKMICSEKQMAQEAKFLSLISGPVTTRYTINGNLILADDKGNRITLQQVV
ncbi:MAG: META domain-containing protein [Sphingorhabdus sp.]